MRIGIDCRSYGPSGGYMGVYMESLVSYLDQNGDTDEYVLFFSNDQLDECIPKSPRIRAVRTPARTGSWSEQFTLPYQLRKERLDIMLFPEPNIPLLHFGKSMVLIPDLVPYFYPEKHLKSSWMRHWSHFVLRESIRKSHAAIAFSDVLKRDIIEIFDTHEDRIHIIPPMYREIQPSGKSETGLFLSQEGISEKYILSVGELREYKNIPRLLQAYSLLLKEDRIDADLVLVGKEDPTYHDIRSTLIQLELQSRVHIYNVLDEDKVGLLYQNASLYTLPSLYEGSEQAILAPLAHGLPIASSLLPSITNVLSGEDAVFFRPMSVPEIAEALERALSGPHPKGNKKDMSAYSASSVGAKILGIFSLCREEKTNS